MANHFHSRMQHDNISGHKGVSWSIPRQKWIAQIGFEGRTYYLGGFSNIEDALRAREEGVQKYHGDAALEPPFNQGEYYRKWARAHPDKISRSNKNHRVHNGDEVRRKAREKIRQTRMEMIAAYGGVCECCGEGAWEFLTVDHINGDGAHERKMIGSGTTFYRSLKKRGFPRDRYRLLCYNCNLARGHSGYCPHERQVERLLAVA